ncbi:MAG: hypothetical protein K0S47_991 [Herbinix sp.]|jgi:predicted PurR-regulated permease PerM|nr:hypothetical protein [Herbinix sp.]
MKWKDKFNHKYLQISLYVIITSIIIYSLSLVAKNAPTIAAEVMIKVRWLIRVVRPLILGFAFAYLMDPVVSFFERRYRNDKLRRIIKAPRSVAVITSMLLLFVALAALISLLVSSVTNQIRLANFDDIIRLGQEYMSGLDSFYQTLLKKLEDLDIQSQEIQQYVTDATTFVVDLLRNFADGIINSLTNLSGYLTTIIFSFIIGVYLLIDGRMFMDYIKKVNSALLSKNTNRRLQNIIHDLDQVFSGYIRGQLTDAFVMMILISLVLTLTGVKFAIVIGVIAGIGNLIPYFGPIVAYIGTILVCLVNGDFKTMIISIIALAIIQAIDGNVIGPKLLSRSIQIHPLIIIISLIFGSAVGGFLGMLLAVPIGAYVKLVFVRFVDNQIKRKEEHNEEE